MMMKVRPLNRDNTVAALGRYMLIMPALGVALTTFAVVAVAYLWWNLIGWTCQLLGKRVGLFLGRYLGCYPFVFILVGWAAVVAVFLWAGGRKPYLVAYSDITGEMLDEIAKYPSLKRIGGLW